MLGALGFKALAVDVYRGNVATDREVRFIIKSKVCGTPS